MKSLSMWWRTRSLLGIVVQPYNLQLIHGRCTGDTSVIVEHEVYHETWVLEDLVIYNMSAIVHAIQTFVARTKLAGAPCILTLEGTGLTQQVVVDGDVYKNVQTCIWNKVPLAASSYYYVYGVERSVGVQYQLLALLSNIQVQVCASVLHARLAGALVTKADDFSCCTSYAQLQESLQKYSCLETLLYGMYTLIKNY